MGVIYKIRPEIREFILEEKKTNPILSCRGLVEIIAERFQVKLSKSRVNSVIQEAQLSMPVGRRRTKRKYIPREKPAKIFAKPAPVPIIKKAPEPIIEKPLPLPPVEKTPEPVVMPVEKPVEIPSFEALPAELPTQRESSGAILLKAADYLLGGSEGVVQLVKSRLNQPNNEILTKTEGLIYLPLFELAKEGQGKDFSALWSLIDRQMSLDDLMSYLIDLKEVKTINLDLFRLFSSFLPEVRCLRVILSDKNFFYLDGQLHTIWSTAHTPYNFSATNCNIKSYIDRHFQKEEPFVFFVAPGYDTPTKEFFDFMLAAEAEEKKFVNLILYGNKFEQMDTLSLERQRKHSFIFGLWPWQYAGCREVKKMGLNTLLSLPQLKEDFYLTETEIELSQPIVKQKVTLRGAILRKAPSDKPRFIILSNLRPEQATTEDIVKTYLNRWPNLEEGFEDFSRKIELFTYTAHSQRFFSTDKFNLPQETTPDIKTLFKDYLEALDLYVKWHFLPSGYENKDFKALIEHFYTLPCQLKKQEGLVLVNFQPLRGYPFLKDLEYACRRLNEREISLYGKSKLCCVVTPA